MNDAAITVLGEGRFLRLVSRDGWEYVERPHVGGIVALIPVTDRGELVLVEQYRPPVNARVIEPPAGIAGDIPGQEDEALKVAAQRELEEETGFTANRLVRVAEGPPSGGQSTEVLSFFLATGLTKHGEGGGDHSEDITVHVVPLTTIDTWLEARASDACLIDPKVYTSIHFARRHLSKGGR